MTGSTATLERMVRDAAASLIAATRELCDLDSVAGDGDHGFAMAGASRAILDRLDTAPPESVGGLLDLVGHEFAQVGGSMGALLSVAVETVADTVAASPSADDPDLVTRLLSAAQDAITEFGGAKPGDKTIVDALDAAREASLATATPATLAERLERAAEGARAGAEATRAMPARIGRASRLGDTALGSPDAGATSFAIVLGALATSYAEGTA